MAVILFIHPHNVNEIELCVNINKATRFKHEFNLNKYNIILIKRTATNNK